MRLTRSLQLIAFTFAFLASAVTAAPNFIKTDQVYRLIVDDNPKAMLVLQKDSQSNWVRAKPVNKDNASSIWINLDNVQAIQPLQ